MTDMVTVDRFNREIDRLDEGIDKLDRKIEMIDQSGTRGLGVLAVQINEQTKDMARLEVAFKDDMARIEKTVNAIAEEQKRLRSVGWKNLVLFATAMIPVYLFAAAWFMGKR